MTDTTSQVSHTACGFAVLLFSLTFNAGHNNRHRLIPGLPPCQTYHIFITVTALSIREAIAIVLAWARRCPRCCERNPRIFSINVKHHHRYTLHPQAKTGSD